MTRHLSHHHNNMSNIQKRAMNIWRWIIFYRDAIICAKHLYVTPDRLSMITELKSIKDIIGTYHYSRAFTKEELEFIAKSIWWLGWSTALFGFGFIFGCFGMESPSQAFLREYNPIRSILYNAQRISCSICLGPFHSKQHTCEFGPCGHYFHTECLQSWLKVCHEKISCPVCRGTATLG